MAKTSLLAEINSHIPVKGPRCGLAAIREQLDPADAADLDQACELALKGHGVTWQAIAKALTARGHNIRANSVSRHTRGECACGAR